MLSIHYFLVVAQEGNMTAAAAKLHVSQPALSSMIAKLEDELGARLFDRVGRNIVLNECGRLFMNRARAIQEQYEGIRRDFFCLKNADDSLTLAVTGIKFPNKMIRNYLKSRPGVRVKQVFINAEDVAARWEKRTSTLPFRPIPLTFRAM